MNASYSGTYKNENPSPSTICMNSDIDKQALPMWLRSCLWGDKNYRIIYSKSNESADGDESDHHWNIPLSNSPQNKVVRIGYTLYKLK